MNASTAVAGAASPGAEAGWLAATQPLDLYAGVVGAVMLIVAAAQWLASYHTDRRALRLFAVRYALAGFGWTFGHPAAHGGPGDVPFTPVVVAVVLLALTVWALDEYLGQGSRRRLAWTWAVALLAIAGLWLYRRVVPDDARGVYVVMAFAMGWCALNAWWAARRENNRAQLVVALAFASYPALVVAVLVVLGVEGRRPDFELGYLAAWPALIAGVTILVVSLIRAGQRLESELALRLRAERELRETNATLEQRVAERTGELRMIVDGLEAFTRNVSHDLRGPLAGLAGIARLADDALARGDDDAARRLLAPIAPQADRLLTMVQDLLTLSRVTGSDCDRRSQPLRPLVDDALAQLRLAPDSAAQLERVRVEVDALPEAAVDAGMLRQVFVNLVGNALRFATRSDRTPEVRIGTRPHDDGVAIFVADNGVGFRPERADELFKPFGRLHGNDLSGSGVGLSIVRRAVERHGGRVWAETRPGAGATFWFTLGRAGRAPRRVADAAAYPPGASACASRVAPGPKA
jgi:signal transduction histidine kinase